MFGRKQKIIFCSCVNDTIVFSFLRSLLRENGRSLGDSESVIKQLFASVITVSLSILYFILQSR